MKPVLFVGPTLTRAHAIRRDMPLDRVEIALPIRRGDLPGLVAQRPPGVAIIADGVFHASLAVGHAEIRQAIAAGWRVFGVSSMGAIRASEMRDHGMIGFGEVYEEYCRADRDMRDDEVTLVHEPEPPFRELSEPLLHLRRLIAQLVEERVIGPEEGASAIDNLERRWFGDRTLALVSSLLSTPDRHERITAALRDMDRHRIKAHDLLRLLDEQPWLGP